MLSSADVPYLDHRELYRDPPDALVITGTEPVEPDLTAEPYWADLSELLVWAERSVPAVILSCLASHAAALAIDGIRRHPLPVKRSGVYRQRIMPGHILTRRLDEPVMFPHSRINGVSPVDLVEHGYEIALRSDGGEQEWTVASRDRDGRLLVLLQGHPEYARTALLREYRRDVRRYMDGTRAAYPEIPDGYLDDTGMELLAAYRDRCIAGAESSPANLPYDVAAAHISARWDGCSMQLFAGCLAEARSRAGLTV